MLKFMEYDEPVEGSDPSCNHVLHNLGHAQVLDSEASGRPIELDGGLTPFNGKEPTFTQDPDSINVLTPVRAYMRSDTSWAAWRAKAIQRQEKHAQHLRLNFPGRNEELIVETSEESLDELLAARKRQMARERQKQFVEKQERWDKLQSDRMKAGRWAQQRMDDFLTDDGGCAKYLQQDAPRSMPQQGGA